MNNHDRIQLRVSQIISTKKRKEILTLILAQPGYFSIDDICQSLQAANAEVRLTTVLNVVKSLHYAGFLTEETEERTAKKTGRSKNLYRVAN
jgi:Fe2+ or Zn2+ uptake regulation protein